MSNYEELETAESPEEIEEVEEVAGGENEIEILYKFMVTYSGPEWPKVRLTEGDMEMVLTLANECTMDVLYAGWTMKVPTEQNPATLSPEDLKAMVEERMEAVQEVIDNEEPIWVDSAEVQVVNAENGEPVEGMTFGRVAMPASNTWGPASERMGVNGDFVRMMREQNNIDNDEAQAAFQGLEEAVVELIGDAGRKENLKQTTQSAVVVLEAEIYEGM